MYIPSTFLDTRSPLSPATRQDDIPEKSYVKLGQPAVISRGKHAGKTGTVTHIEQKYIRLMEHVTNIEVRTRIILRSEALAYRFVS